MLFACFLERGRGWLRLRLSVPKWEDIVPLGPLKVNVGRFLKFQFNLLTVNKSSIFAIIAQSIFCYFYFLRNTSISFKTSRMVFSICSLLLYMNLSYIYNLIFLDLIFVISVFCPFSSSSFAVHLSFYWSISRYNFAHLDLWSVYFNQLQIFCSCYSHFFFFPWVGCVVFQDYPRKLDADFKNLKQSI